jgi:TIR domain
MPEAEGGRIFVSYRRQETSHLAGRLSDLLAYRFGEGQVFIDVDAIEPGVDFADEITRAVATCRVLLAVIGPNWLSATDERGRRRLDDPDDIVRLEIQAALDRGVRVIPIMVEGAVMPGRQDLPECLASLARRHALTMRHESFRSDAGRLVTAIERLLAEATGATGAHGTEQAQAQKTGGQSPSIEISWNDYETQLQPDRLALVRSLFDRIQKAIEDRNLMWVPVLRSAYFCFQRAGGYNCAGVDIFRERPVEFWVKLPLPPDELRRLGHDIPDPYPELESRWDMSNKQWRWAVPTLDAVPDVGPAIELTNRYQPPGGRPMPIPAG